MLKKIALLCAHLAFASLMLPAQNARILAGPIIGHLTPTSLTYIVLVENWNAEEVLFEGIGNQVMSFTGLSWKNVTPVRVRCGGLGAGTTYTGTITIKANGTTKLARRFTLTTPLRTPDASAPVSFLLGSCAFIGTGAQKMVPAGNTRIFTAMAADSTDFMLWLGDNTYYINNEFNSVEGMMRKQIKVHQNEDLEAFLRTRPNYAIWDDHDYGPNNSDRTFKGKADAREVFTHFWANPAYGLEETPGVFFKLSRGDCDFFMLDDRWYRDDSGKTDLLGPGQLKWLMEGLKNSTATFKFIALGSEVLNEISDHEAWELYAERDTFFEFIEKEHISGIVFLTGDRHFTELLKKERPGTYALHDFTCSPLTSWVRKKAGVDKEKANPLRVEGTHYLNQNYGKITVEGPVGSRVCKIEVKDAEGKLVWTRSITEQEVK